MGISDRIAKRIILSRRDVLDNCGGKWDHMEAAAEELTLSDMNDNSTVVTFGKNSKLICEVVADEKSQVIGLQKYAALPDDYGMLFPYSPPRGATFHMASVSFPIDIIFVGPTGKVNRIVEDAQPGTRETWGMPYVSAVVEANGGFCKKNGIEIGCDVSFDGIGHTAQEHFPDYPRKDINPALTPTNSTADRFRDRDSIDNQVGNQQASPGHYDSTMGYDQTKNMEDTVGPIRPSASIKMRDL